MSLYNVKLRYVSPESLKIPISIKNHISKKNIEQTWHTDLNDVLGDYDVIYMTKIQKKSLISMNKIKDSYILTPKILTHANKIWLLCIHNTYMLCQELMK